MPRSATDCLGVPGGGVKSCVLLAGEIRMMTNDDIFARFQAMDCFKSNGYENFRAKK